MSQPTALRRKDLDPDPIKQFQTWYAAAQQVEHTFVDAMTLATASPEGIPSARMVLLRKVDASGFRFFTSYESCKAADLDANPHAALVLYWHESRRQVRIKGAVERLSKEESEQYFATRPHGSQINAWASHQSSVLENRDILTGRNKLYEQRYASQAVPKPTNWGGYRVIPAAIEFWQNGEFRLHDRFRYTLEGAGWKIERLSP